MAEKSLTQKLLIKPGSKLLALNAPDYFAALLGELPEGVTLETQPTAKHVDVMFAFLQSKGDVDLLAPQAVQAVKPGGILWFCYPKLAGKRYANIDLNRDRGWDALTALGYTVVTAIAIDEKWSGLRFRPTGEIKVLTRKNKN